MNSDHSHLNLRNNLTFDLFHKSIKPYLLCCLDLKVISLNPSDPSVGIRLVQITRELYELILLKGMQEM